MRDKEFKHFQKALETKPSMEVGMQISGKFRPKDYTHKDDPLTAKVKCEECGGTGHIETANAMQDYGDDITDIRKCPNPHCRNGMVEMTLCVVVVHECPHSHDNRACDEAYYRNPSECEKYEDCNWTEHIPLTYTNAGEHRDTSTYEWRILET